MARTPKPTAEDPTIRLARRLSPNVIEALAHRVHDPKASDTARNRAAWIVLETAGYVRPPANAVSPTGTEGEPE